MIAFVSASSTACSKWKTHAWHVSKTFVEVLRFELASIFTSTSEGGAVHHGGAYVHYGSAAPNRPALPSGRSLTSVTAEHHENDDCCLMRECEHLAVCE